MVSIKEKHMKYLQFLYIVIILLLSACTYSRYDVNDDVIIFDYRKQYPVLELKLSDLADISYVPLKGEDSINFLTNVYDLSENIYIDNDWIIIGDCLPNKDIEPKNDNIIYLFDKDGYFARSFKKGSKSSNDWESSKRMLYDNTNKEIIIHQKSYFGNILEHYDIYGNHISTDTLKNPYFNSVFDGRKITFQNIYTKYAVNGKTHGTGGASINVYDIDSRNYVDIEQLPHEHIVLDYSGNKHAPYALYASKNGIYITDSRTETVYFLDKKYEISPKFRSIQSSKHKNRPDIQNLVYPLVETDEYILFCNDMDFDSQTTHRFKYGNYIYIKGEKKIYQLSDLGYIDYDFNKHKDIIVYEDHLLKDEIFLTNQFKTLNADILICVIEPFYLIDNYNTLPPELKDIASNITPYDNPILMVMRFGKELRTATQQVEPL